MVSKILIAAATPYEIGPLIAYLEQAGSAISKDQFRLNDKELRLLITGVGVFNMSLYCGLLFGSGYRPALAINAGLAGTFEPDRELTSVVNVYRDTFGDIGVTNSDGSFSSVFDLELIKPDEAPFKQGWLENKSGAASFLPNVSGITVNATTGDAGRIKMLKEKFTPGVESMEGAAFAHACAVAGVEYLQLRALSNYVEPRNKLNWKIDKSIANLNEVLLELLNEM